MRLQHREDCEYRHEYFLFYVLKFLHLQKDNKVFLRWISSHLWYHCFFVLILSCFVSFWFINYQELSEADIMFSSTSGVTFSYCRGKFFINTFDLIKKTINLYQLYFLCSFSTWWIPSPSSSILLTEWQDSYNSRYLFPPLSWKS